MASIVAKPAFDSENHGFSVVCLSSRMIPVRLATGAQFRRRIGSVDAAAFAHRRPFCRRLRECHPIHLSPHINSLAFWAYRSVAAAIPIRPIGRDQRTLGIKHPAFAVSFFHLPLRHRQRAPIRLRYGSGRELQSNSSLKSPHR